MENKEKFEFPKGFFSLKRPKIIANEAMDDIIPIKWSEEVMKKSKKAVVYSAKSNKIKTI